MIISHRHRFIFLKTRKTAGTSIEMALRPLLGPEDISTPWEPDEETTFGEPGPSNYDIGEPRWTLRNISRWVRGKPRRRQRLYDHDSAETVRAHVGEDVWNEYYRFCVERNPWDRQASLYYYNLKRHNRTGTFAQSLERRRSIVDNWKIYTIDDVIAVNDVLRYESLADDFAAACRRIGIDAPVLPRAKSGLRDAGSYRPLYDDALREKVARMYRKEIEAFGYEF